MNYNARNRGVPQQLPQTAAPIASSSFPDDPYQPHLHGKKPSLAGFDPFSSASTKVVVSPSNNNNNCNYDVSPAEAARWGASPMDRDSSPTVSADNVHQQRHPITPPSAERPIASNSKTDISDFERFDNEKIKNKKLSKTVNKFLRKAIIVKSRSLGQHSPKRRSGSTSPDAAPTQTAASANHSKGGARGSPTANKFLCKASIVKSLSLGQHGPSTSHHKKTKDQKGRSSGSISPVAAAMQATATVSVARERQGTTTTETAQGSEDATATTTSGGSSRSSPDTTNMAQDLLELKDPFSKLQLPSLQAKNAATSFLTGRGEEAVSTTCSNEPTPFQLEIPSLSEVVTIARLNEFVENYRMHDQNLDPTQFVGWNRLRLQNAIDNNNSNANSSNSSQNNKNKNSINNIVKEHVPIVQSLLDCSEGEEISIQGFLTETGNLSADSRAEAVVFQGQRNFTVVFRGTTEQQSKVLGSGKSKKRAVPLDDRACNRTVEVYSGFLERYSRIEEECFDLVDKLVENNPFCDVVFSGYSFGAAMATLAAFRYATARPTMRVGCLTLASPKVGFSHFQNVVNNSPNLKVMRLELGGQTETKCQGPTMGGWHVGHTLVLNSSGPSSSSGSPTGTSSSSTSSEKKPSVSVYKFETPKHKNGGFFKTANPGLKKYISILEDLATHQKNSHQTFVAADDKKNASSSSSSWPKDFANNAGKGVVVNNEKRLVV